jgi:hypothetical protein
MANRIPDRKSLDDDLASKRHTYAVQLLQNEVGRVWQRSLVFWGLVAASFVAFGAFSEKEKFLTVVIACFGFISSVCWTLVNRASTWNQNHWVDKVDRLERRALKMAILREGVPRKKFSWWGGWRYSASKLMIALSDLAVLVWFVLGLKSSLPFLQGWPSKWNGSVVALLLGTAAYIILVLYYTRTDLQESTSPPPPDPS